MFAADSFPASAALDNLGLPESGDGISDVLQEAKWEADFLAKMQDTRRRILLPRLSAEPRIRRQRDARQGRPASRVAEDHCGHRGCRGRARADALLRRVQAGTIRRQPRSTCRRRSSAGQFLTNAIARNTARMAPTRKSRITATSSATTTNSPGPLAKCSSPLATDAYHTTAHAWFDPDDPATCRWGWWRLSSAMAARSAATPSPSRADVCQAGQLDAVLPREVRAS